MKKSVLAFLAILVVLCGVSLGLSQTSPSKNYSGIRISNFGKMDDRFYRGGQPKKDDFSALKALGVQTVIDLQNKPKEYERIAVEAAGMRYINIPVVDSAPPTDEQVAIFLKTMDDPATGIAYVHCAGGRHRTGDMGAVYRLNKYGWTFDKAYQEMKNYDFYTSWGHGSQKDFVVDYFAKNELKRAQTAAALSLQAVASGK